MLIALLLSFVAGLFYWKRSRKASEDSPEGSADDHQRSSRTSMVAIGLILLGCATSTADAQQSERYEISGTIHHDQGGRIRCFLVDEETFRTPMTGLRSFELVPREASGQLAFRIDDVPAGTYGLRCFQDTNDNGRLDRGAFGPSEPWGMSWNHGRSRGWPRFRHIAFELRGHRRDLNITLR